MLNTIQVQNFYEVELSLPKESCVLEYRFINELTSTIKNKAIRKTIIREVEIRFSGKENNLWRYQLVVLKYKIITDNDTSTTIVEKKASIFNEIIVHVNQYGNIVKLLNLKQLQDNWDTAKKEMRDKHQGQVLEDFFADTDDLIETEKSLLRFITSKDMYGLYFNSCWGNHDVRKPRYEGLNITIAKRIQEDVHNQDLQKIFSQDAVLEYKKTSEEKIQESEFTYKNKQLQEAFLEITMPNNHLKYAIICLKP